MSAQMLIRPPDSLKRLLQQEAATRGVSLNALVIQLLWGWVERNRHGPDTNGNVTAYGPVDKLETSV